MISISCNKQSNEKVTELIQLTSFNSIELNDVFEVQLSPMSDFSKFKNKEPDFVLNYICNLGKYIPEN